MEITLKHGNNWIRFHLYCGPIAWWRRFVYTCCFVFIYRLCYYVYLLVWMYASHRQGNLNSLLYLMKLYKLLDSCCCSFFIDCHPFCCLLLCSSHAALLFVDMLIMSWSCCCTLWCLSIVFSCKLLRIRRFYMQIIPFRQIFEFSINQQQHPRGSPLFF